MSQEIKILSIRLRAMAQATEVEERVLKAIQFASGTEEIAVTRTEGHFGTPITVFEAELLKARDIRQFIERLDSADILSRVAGEADARTDEDCVFHIRLDKQSAFLEELHLAGDKDVIDVRLKVGVYPASREAAVKIISDWLGAQD